MARSGRTNNVYPSPIGCLSLRASFKSCPVMGTNMDMNDPRWQSLREAARRLLREDDCTLIVPENIESAWKLVQLISDYVPSKLGLPKVIEGVLSVVGLAQIGGKEPSLDICWVPDCGLEGFDEQVVDLLEAGYPGCVGCGGPGSEGEWDEVSPEKSEFSGKKTSNIKQVL